MPPINQSAVFCFSIILSYFGIAVTDTLTEPLRSCSQDDVDMQLIKCAAKQKLKSKLLIKKDKQLKNINFPLIMKDKKRCFFILIKLSNDKAVIMSNNNITPATLTLEDFYEMWDGTAIAVYKKGTSLSHDNSGLKWFIPSILNFKKEFIVILIAVLTIQLFGILTPIMTQVVVDKVISHNSISTLTALAIGIGIVYIFELMISLAKNHLFAHTTNRIDVILNYRLFKHLFSLPLKYFETRRAGETIARVKELDHIRSFLTGTPLSSLVDLVFIVVYITILYMYNVKLATIVMISVLAYALLSLIITPVFKRRLKEKFEAGAESQSFLVEAIHGIQTVKALSLSEKLENKWGALQAEYVKTSYKTSLVSSAAGSIGQFIQKMFDLLVLTFGALTVMYGDFTVGQLVAFRMLSGRVSGPVLRLVQLWQEYQQATLSSSRIGDIFNCPPEHTPNNTISKLPKFEGSITFENLRFRYRPDYPEVIRDLSFCIEKGTVIGIVGRSGSGKSTISKLLQRLYIPEAGKITVDGFDISMLDPVEYRKQIGVVLQDSFMFNGTIAENISIHKNSVSFEKIIQAAKTAGAHDFIMALPNGYDTIIGEKGIALSGGQKQRIAIARALIGDPRILILDEATSALDYESENIIQNNLKDICNNRTVILIAHRMSTLRDAEKIMVIDDGKLAEYDTHDNLMKMKGLYYHLYIQQAGGEIS